MDVVVGIGINFVSNLITFLAGSVVTLLAIRIIWVRKLLRKVGVVVPVSRPQLDLDIERDDYGTTEIIIKNAGDKVAYNVYVFLFELFWGSEDESYQISSLGTQKVRVGLLSPNEKVVFKGKVVSFSGCNVTSEQEIWVEYTDENDEHYRTRIVPPSARGDALRVMPPEKIKMRLPLLPGLKFTGNRDWKNIKLGKKGIKGLNY